MAKKKPSKDAEVQEVMEDVFPERDEDLETLTSKYLKDLAKEEAATTSVTGSYDALKAEMQEKGLDTYYCYTSRKKVVLQPEKAKLKVKDVKVDESTPFKPSS